MKIQNHTQKIIERTSSFLKSGVIKQKPAWYDVVAAHPPATDLTKNAKILGYSQYKDPMELKRPNQTRVKNKKLDSSKIHAIPKIKLFEDQLRNYFYAKHPWEFSRPKILVENEGNEIEKCDWSHLLQLNKPLDGESVVQRTLWLIKNEKLSLNEAYDKSRFEFYNIRMREELQSLNAKEEGMMYGSLFSQDNLSKGVALEQEFIDDWAKLASEQTQIFQTTRSTNKFSDSEGNEPSKSLFESNNDIEYGDKN